MKLSAICMLIGMAVVATSCSAGEKESSAMSEHFRQRQMCLAFTDSIVGQAAKELFEFDSISEMRTWISNNRKNDFSRIVLSVQDKTRDMNINVANDDDQLVVLRFLSDAADSIHGYKESRCDSSDVREYFAQSLYLGIGGLQSTIAKRLSKEGFDGVTAQSHYLLTSLLVGNYRNGSQ